MEHEVEGSRRRGRPKRTWKEVVREDCQARKLNKEDAMDRCKWRKVIKEVHWPGWVWAGECFFWYRPTRVVPDKRSLNGCCVGCQWRIKGDTMGNSEPCTCRGLCPDTPLYWLAFQRSSTVPTQVSVTGAASKNPSVSFRQANHSIVIVIVSSDGRANSTIPRTPTVNATAPQQSSHINWQPLGLTANKICTEIISTRVQCG